MSRPIAFQHDGHTFYAFPEFGAFYAMTDDHYLLACPMVGDDDTPDMEDVSEVTDLDEQEADFRAAMAEQFGTYHFANV